MPRSSLQATAETFSAAVRTGESAPCRSLHLLGPGNPPCGIGDFGKLLLTTLREIEPRSHAALILEPRRFDPAAVWRALGRTDVLVANFPVVAWKRALAEPLAAYAVAALRGKRRVTVLHEWAGLHRLRRFVLRPVLLLSNAIVLVSPVVKAELAADPLVGFLHRRGALLPLPPNLARPSETNSTELRVRMLAAKAEGRLVLGHFGSIYPGKHPEAMLDVAAALKARGVRPLLVFMGSFIAATDGVEAVFWNKVAALGLADDVVVSGYVAGPRELFGLFEAADAFAYVLPEGLTARRGSVLACVQAGRPVVVTAPARADEFDHHPRFRALVDSGAIVLAPRASGADAYADLVIAARDRPTAMPDLDMGTWFKDAARFLVGQLRGKLERA